MNCKLTDFSDYSDLTSYINCRDNQGGTPQHCLSVGDNGTGASGKITAQDHTPMVALPSADIRAKWGSTTSAWGKMVNVTYAGKTIKAELADISPTGVCDLNPAALAALGQKHPFSDQGSWEWADVPTPPAPIPAPKIMTHFALIAESTKLTFFEFQKIAEANTEQSADIAKHWGGKRRYDMTAYKTESEVPMGHFKGFNQDDIGEPGALGYHSDENNQPYYRVQVQDLDGTSITNSHEAIETDIDAFGNRFIKVNIAPYGDVLILVEPGDPVEAFSYKTSNGLPVSDFITPEFFDEVKTPGTKYSFGDNLPGPLTVAKGGYFSFKDKDGKFWQRTWWDGDAPVDEGPFSWELKHGEMVREMVDRETRLRRNI